MQQHVLLVVSGGIAAYKSAELTSRLIKAGYRVRVVMTESATRFIAPLTFRALTGQPVLTTCFEGEDPIPHISLADRADLMVVAPATASILARIAHGMGDDLAAAAILARKSPLLLVPAMNVRMYANPAVQRNLSLLREQGVLVMEPDTGRLACGTTGKGRFPDPSEIVFFIRTCLEYPLDLTGKRILVTAGACREAIDPMRVLTNRSTGRMGLAIARAAAIRGADVLLVHAWMDQPVPYYLPAIKTESSAEMHLVVSREAPGRDIIFMTAAVADYTVPHVAPQKIRKDRELHLELTRTIDILSELGKNKPAGQTLVGFAAESRDHDTSARSKLERKNLDFICVNDISVAGREQTQLKVITRDRDDSLTGDKFDVAHQILDRVTGR